MPIFEFRCQDCGNLFEKLFLNPNEEVDIECPNCRSKSFQRVISKTNHNVKSGSESAGKGESKTPQVSTKSCSPGNTCSTIEIPGPEKD